MKNILVINAGQNFEHSGGLYNETLTKETVNFFEAVSGVDVQVTDIDKGYDAVEEAKKFVWADYIIYHTPIW